MHDYDRRTAAYKMAPMRGVATKVLKWAEQGEALREDFKKALEDLKKAEDSGDYKAPQGFPYRSMHRELEEDLMRMNKGHYEDLIRALKWVLDSGYLK
jgi:hypothetical protein